VGGNCPSPPGKKALSRRFGWGHPVGASAFSYLCSMPIRSRLSEILGFSTVLFVANAWVVPWWQGEILTGSEVAVYGGLSLLGGVGYHFTTQWLKRRRERS
jgi:hypothetical protein